MYTTMQGHGNTYIYDLSHTNTMVKITFQSYIIDNHFQLHCEC